MGGSSLKHLTIDFSSGHNVRVVTGGNGWTPTPYPTPPIIFFFKDFLYLFMRHTERGRDTGRGRSRLLAESLMLRDLIPGPWDHDLSQRQMLN